MKPGSVIGVVGGGQLGRMSAMAAARLGFLVHVFSPEPEAPAVHVAARCTVAAYDDLAALKRFADAVDVITFEFENLPAESLALLESLKPVRPGAGVLAISQDRVLEKQFLNDAGIATAPWVKIESLQALQTASHQLGWPAILKTTRLGYDGKGQAMLRAPQDLAGAFARLAPKPLILEGFVDFDAEISVMVARGIKGEIVCFDAVENRHKDHILDMTLAPAPLAPEILAQAQQIARLVAEKLDLVGLLGVEMFVTGQGEVVVNEIAPRPHNSGHWTMDACPCSQFEMQIRAVAGLPLPPAIRHSDAVMKNLIGPEDMALWPRILATPGLIPHHYCKTEARPGRKMGHFNRLFQRGGLPSASGIETALRLRDDLSGSEELGSTSE